MVYKKILELCFKQGYLYKNQIENSFKTLVLGPTGALLQENLKNEWFYSMQTNMEYSVFFNTNSFKSTFAFAKDISMSNLPFGISEIIEDKTVHSEDVAKNNAENDMLYWFKGHKECLRCTIFLSPSDSTHVFHQLQRQRRMWWRKFSALPGRYTLTDIQSNIEGQNVDITSKHSWATQVVEKISLHTNEHPLLSIEDLQAKFGRRKVQAHYITSNIYVPILVLNTICDAYDEPSFQSEPRPLLRLHRKIAPYKISFAIPISFGTKSEGLVQLGLYLCKKLRAQNVSSLLLPSASKLNLDIQYQQYDQLGVPYTVVLNENSLKNGIIQLRNRDTTLKEQVHMTDLPVYVENLLKNF